MEFKKYTDKYINELKTTGDTNAHYSLFVIKGLGSDLIDAQFSTKTHTRHKQSGGKVYETQHRTWLTPREVEYSQSIVRNNYTDVTVEVYQILDTENPTSN